MTNPLPGEFRCGDCITVRHHGRLVEHAVDYNTRHAIDNAHRMIERLINNGLNPDVARSAMAWFEAQMRPTR